MVTKSKAVMTIRNTDNIFIGDTRTLVFNTFAFFAKDPKNAEWLDHRATGLVVTGVSFSDEKVYVLFIQDHEDPNEMSGCLTLDYTLREMDVTE
jgi:hypothetical protein